jgi:mono/diheme cytochrome c family protein
VLTFYMPSRTNEQMATYYSSVRLIPSAGYGRQLFIEKNCMACHSIGGVGCHGVQLQGGVPNPNSQGGEVPSLLHASDDYTKEEVIKIIRNGKAPPLYMPS